jgi:hypothetical protein
MSAMSNEERESLVREGFARVGEVLPTFVERIRELAFVVVHRSDGMFDEAVKAKADRLSDDFAMLVLTRATAEQNPLLQHLFAKVPKGDTMVCVFVEGARLMRTFRLLPLQPGGAA